MPARLPLLLFVALCLIPTACGGDDPDAPVRGYFEAIVDGDGKRACDQLSEELRQEIERTPAARRTGSSCADVMELAAGLNPGLDEKDVEGLAIDVEENGDQAVAELKNPLAGRRETLDLVKEDGDWRISSLETRPRG